MITITAKKDGFRRCGVAHSREPVEYADDRFSEEELSVLQAEPMLVVTAMAAAPTRPNAADTIKLVNAAATTEVLDELTAGEDRKSVLAAIERRRVGLVGDGNE